MSFRIKTILGIALIEIVLLFILIWSSLDFLKTSNEEELAKRASTAAALFATSSKDALLATDIASLESLIEQVLKNRGVVYARVASVAEGVLAQGGDEAALKKTFAVDHHIDDVQDGVFDAEATIKESGVEYGRVELGLSIDEYTSVLHRAKARTVTIAAVEIGLTALFSFLLGTYLTRQLKGLSDASRRLAAGDLGYQLSVRGRDELAQTAEAFNEMSRRLQISLNRRKQAEAELERLNEDLERRVNLRTKSIVAVNRQLEYQALHDSLTKLPNRLLFGDRLQQALLSAMRIKAQVAVAVIDFDGFKLINDTLGHHVGDLVLQQFAHRMRATLRQSDTLARLGGDEFVLLMPNVSGRDDAVRVARRILDGVQAPLTIGGESFSVSVSVGVSVFPDDADTADGLVSRADAAMYIAKRGKCGIALYDPAHDQKGKERSAVLADLRHAIERDQLVLHYQPKIEFRTGEVSGVTALVRWNHPQYGLMMPDDFIPRAEEAGLAGALSLCVVRLALRQASEWRSQGITLPIAVNISGINLQDREFPEQVGRLLQAAQVPGAALEIAVTESAIMVDPLQAMDVVTQLHAMGIGLSISDFGHGYSFINYLNKFLLARLKIDRSVILGMLESESSAAIVSATIGLAHSLGLKVVAEGVESETHWDHLKTLGCDSGLGYYMSRPLPPAEFAEWFQRSRGESPGMDGARARGHTPP